MEKRKGGGRGSENLLGFPPLGMGWGSDENGGGVLFFLFVKKKKNYGVVGRELEE